MVLRAGLAATLALVLPVTVPASSAESADVSASADPVPSRQITSDNRGSVLVTSPCDVSVTFVGVRGSGESGRETDWLGSYGRSAFRRFSNQLEAGHPHGYHGIQYPAVAVSNLTTKKGQRRFVDSIDQGFIELLRFLVGRHRRCPEERFVLFGYSQGAMAVHRFAQRSLPTRPGLRAAVQSIIFLADGDARRDESTTHFGTQPDDRRSNGVWWLAPHSFRESAVWPPKRVPLVPRIAARSVHICNVRDVVCDPERLLAACGVPAIGVAWQTIECYRRGVDAHTSYTIRGAHVRSAAQRENSKPPWPAIVSSRLPTATVGEPYREVLLASTPDGTWELAPGEFLPPGLALESGAIVGTPEPDAVDLFDIYNQGYADFQPEIVYTTAAGRRVSERISLRVTELRGRIIYSAIAKDGRSELFSIAPDGTGRRRLTNNGLDESEPVWAPGRARIAFTVPPSGEGETGLYTADASGSSHVLLAGDYSERGFEWAPDGTRIAWIGRSVATRWRDILYVANPDGSDLQDLGEADTLSWSPDGDQIAFSDWTIDFRYVGVQDVDGSVREVIVPCAESPAWSGDGRYLAVVYRHSDAPECTMGPGNSGALMLFDLSDPFGTPTLLDERYFDGRTIQWGGPEGLTLAAETASFGDDDPQMVLVTDVEGTVYVDETVDDLGRVEDWSPDGLYLLLRKRSGGPDDFTVLPPGGTGHGFDAGSVYWWGASWSDYRPKEARDTL